MIFVTAFIITVISIICCKEIKKPTVRVIFGMVAFFNILIMILAGSITYTTKYKIHEVASYNSPDGKYELLFQQVGDPDWPFGHTHARLVLTDESGTIGKCSFDIADDGGNACPDQCQVTWKDTYVEAVISGKEQDDNQYILYFDGKTDSKQLSEIPEWEKGYDLPIDEREREEAENDCSVLMERSYEIYDEAGSGSASNAVLSEDIIFKLQKKLMETGYPVTTSVTYSNMGNYEIVDSFLDNCTSGEKGSVVIYKIHNDGAIGRMKFYYDGRDMYVVSSRSRWNKNGKPEMSYISHNRIKTWKYTDKGWFCYELCVPEPPEVTEIMDGSCLIRVKPMTEEQRDMSIRCVRDLGYQGNNLLCSNWNADNMSELDYNGMFEYLYGMKYGEKFRSEDYPDGIPEKKFENLIMEYLPVTKEQIREYAVYDEDNQTYLWRRLGCFNYTPSFFGTSLPEVVDVKKNEDGTITLTVDAVCDMVICDDAVITHELTVRFKEDGSFQYMGNKILNDGIKHIPDYQYRVGGDGSDSEPSLLT